MEHIVTSPITHGGRVLNPGDSVANLHPQVARWLTSLGLVKPVPPPAPDVPAANTPAHDETAAATASTPAEPKKKPAKN